ncbi:MAG TPA: polyphosphate kinase 2 family protein [Methyloceanibacter sp.]|jgi:PPK2 family polyphosphate:nucleotide phosphotransferase|nr:polyphosphate kinase 2 family protein [Methyloceanibacter sp.]
MLPSEIIAHCRIDKGGDFKLADRDPSDTFGLAIEKEEADALLAAGTKRLSKLQERLYAEGRWAVLAILQGPDTSGKDGVIKHVLSGINPQGCEVHSFKQPSALELAHDFLWRTTMALPARGHVGVYNRSYYEETIVVRVHPELLDKQNLPNRLVTDTIWKERYEDINNFELHLARSGTVPLKFFLHISKGEQSKRLLARIADPEKRWKFSFHDVEERKLWDNFIKAYDDTIRHTATKHAPWYVVPADRKWFARLVVAATLVERMEALDLQFPKFDEAQLGELKKAEAALLEEAKAPER